MRGGGEEDKKTREGHEDDKWKTSRWSEDGVKME